MSPELSERLKPLSIAAVLAAELAIERGATLAPCHEAMCTFAYYAPCKHVLLRYVPHDRMLRWTIIAAGWMPFPSVTPYTLAETFYL